MHSNNNDNKQWTRPMKNNDNDNDSDNINNALQCLTKICHDNLIVIHFQQWLHWLQYNNYFDGNSPSKGLVIVTVFLWFVGETAAHAEVFQTLVWGLLHSICFCANLKAVLAAVIAIKPQKWHSFGFTTHIFNHVLQQILAGFFACSTLWHRSTSSANFGHICMLMHILWIFDTYFRQILWYFSSLYLYLSCI